MIKTLAKELINGTWRAVENIKYNDGKEVKRILNDKTRIPEEIITVKAGHSKHTQSAIALFLAKIY